jgi:hypothetical protein
MRLSRCEYLAAQENDKHLVTNLIAYAGNLVYVPFNTFVSIGLHERDIFGSSEMKSGGSKFGHDAKRSLFIAYLLCK